MTSVQQVCQELLPDLDEDIFDYIVGALEEFQSEAVGAADPDETEAMISGFLESAEYVSEPEEAAAKAQELVARVSAAASGSCSSDVPQKLSEETKKMMIRVDEHPSSGAAAARVNKNTLMENEPVSDKDQKLAKKRDDKASKKQEKAQKYGKQTPAQQAEQQALQVDAELAAARIAAVQARTKLGAYKGALDAKSFTLPNPGGGQPLLEDAACRLVWGRRYGLIGRNGTGKSTMLRAFAARRVGEVPPNVTVHYVSQEVNLTDEQRLKTPIQIVVDADVERSLLLEELEDLNQQASAGELNAKGSERHGAVLARLEEIGVDSAARRAESLLDNLGFTKELQQRPLSQLSGGW